MHPAANPTAGVPVRGHGGGRKGPRAGFGDQCPRAPEVNPLYVKTKLCKFFASGACSRSAGCKFAHGPDELSALPDFTRTQFCPSLLNSGVCRARACTFAHTHAELRPRIDRPSGVREQAPDATATRACTFAHTQAELPPRVDRPRGVREQAPDAAATRASGRAPSPRRRADGPARRRGQAPPAPLAAPRRGRARGGPPGAGGPAPVQARALLLAPFLEEELLAACLAARKGDRPESPNTQLGAETAEGSPRRWASGSQLSECTEWGPECGSEADGGPPCRVEVRKTFFTVVDDALASEPLGRALSSPAVLRYR